MLDLKCKEVLKDELKNVDEKIQSPRDEMSMDLGVETRRVDEITQYRHVYPVWDSVFKQLARTVPLWTQELQIPLTAPT